ncbi:hypothetical protein [Sphaerisporangium sp. TRM90804]|uniref:hypothetical protein n=1 Tax=Sphaerisporangium sp. TRM90804 TaxID=3031113 RepID=UPI00244CD256|nr:hypothetical protein [Sphaerisporangium sp. TRM90804]MDH2430328.1 hypothetical protein [Sphaerisporangium sp. TRM90804]
MTVPWTAPPPDPTPYLLRERIGDMYAGWVDGRNGVPMLPPPAPSPKGATTVASGGGKGAALPEPWELLPADRADAVLAGPPEPSRKPRWWHRRPSAPGPREEAGEYERYAAVWEATSEETLSTPRIEAIKSQTLAEIADEERRLEESVAVLRKMVARAREDRDVMPRAIDLAEREVDAAWTPPTPQSLTCRRTAEQNTARRPDELIRLRRTGDHRRRVRKAENAYLERSRELAHAIRSEEMLNEIIAHRTAVARAAAHRLHQHGNRRIATYLQQLVRKHKRGPELNLVLLRHPVGPSLPAWVTESE